MATRDIGDMLNAIGQRAADILGKVPEDVYIFIKAGDQWQGGAIFENLPDRVLYHSFDDEMIETVEQLWEAAEPDKQWSVIHFDIKDGRFDAEFLYTDDMELDTFEHDYREDALVARYGDKPVIYPELDEGDWHELTEEELAEIGNTEYDWETGKPIIQD
jgi:hypothetical protein